MFRKYRIVCIIFVVFLVINAFIVLNGSYYGNNNLEYTDVGNINTGAYSLTIHQSMDEPWIDGLRLNINCIAKGFSISEVDLVWEGVGIAQKSLWVIESPTMQNGNEVMKNLAFIPLLAGQAGRYVCHLVTKTKETLVSKSIEISDSYRGIVNSRSTQFFVNKTTRSKSSWFPASNMCGGDAVWQDYANFHHDVLSGKQKAKYLVYWCTSRPCGGHGNRIDGITTLLVLAMLTKRVLLIKMTYPIDINDYVLPNSIQWNHALPTNLKSKQYYLLYTHYYRHYQEFELDLLDPNGVDVMIARIQWGFYYHLIMFHDSLIAGMISKFSLRTQYDMFFLYGCAFSYLFKYRPEVTEEIDSIQSKLGLETGKYISMNVRSCLHDACRYNLLHLKYPWSPTFDCAQKAAKVLAKKLNVSSVPIFLTTDEPAVTKYAQETYGNQIVPSTAPFFHIDKAQYTGPSANSLNRQGFIGILADVEICARAAVLVRSMRSTLSEFMGVIRFFPPERNLHPFEFWQNKSVCEVSL